MTTPLKLARERRHLSQSEVAEAVGIVRGHYGRIENRVVGASPAVAKKLADFFGEPLTRDQILYPEEYVGPSPGARRPVQSAERTMIATPAMRAKPARQGVLLKQPCLSHPGSLTADR